MWTGTAIISNLHGEGDSAMTGNIVLITPDALSALVCQAVRAGVKKALADAASSRNDHMREEEAAPFLALSPNTLRQWRAQGRGPTYRKLGGTVLYTRKDLEDWSAQNRTFTIESPEARCGKPC